MMFTVLLVVFFIFDLNEAKKANVMVTLSRKDALSLFDEGEIWGKRFVNQTADIVEFEVVIDESKLMEIKTKDVLISYDIVWPDAEERIRQSMERINNRTKYTPSMLPDIYFSEYRPWWEMVAWIDMLLLRYPIASREYIGETIEGRQIPVIKLSTSDDNKPGFYIQAVLHAREWLANSATMFILNALCEEYGNDARITEILNAINIYIAPTVNLDGYNYSFTTERMWRKNRRPNTGGTFGVDLNRNYDGPIGVFGGAGSSSNPSSNTYHGTAPFSEPETVASRDFILNEANNIQAVFDMHTSGPLILYPWGYTYEECPDDLEFIELANKQAAAVRAVNDYEYRPIQSSDLYPAAGIAADFGYAQQDALSFTYEGRGPGFDPNPDNIIPAGQEQLQGVLTVAEYIIDNPKS